MIGFWRSKDEIDLPDPAWFVNYSWDSEVREYIAEYLDAGNIMCVQPGLSWCRFRCKKRHVGCATLTDGIYIWPEGLSHYVRVHGVRLPDEFVKHALNNGEALDFEEECQRNWWKEQKGWVNGESFLTPGFGGKLKLQPLNIMEYGKVISFIRKFDLPSTLSTKELLDLLKSKEPIELTNSLDYCDYVDYNKDAELLGIRLEFSEKE